MVKPPPLNQHSRQPSNQKQGHHHCESRLKEMGQGGNPKEPTDPLRNKLACSSHKYQHPMMSVKTRDCSLNSMKKHRPASSLSPDNQGCYQKNDSPRDKNLPSQSSCSTNQSPQSSKGKSPDRRRSLHQTSSQMNHPPASTVLRKSCSSPSMNQMKNRPQQ